MINLQISSNPTALGDRIDCIFLAHTISNIENERVNLLTNMKDLIQLNDLTDFGDIVFNQPEGLNTKWHYNHIKDQKFYLKYSKRLIDIPPCKNIPEKYIFRIVPYKYLLQELLSSSSITLFNTYLINLKTQVVY